MDDRRALQADRIACAADWLARARQRVEDGDPARGVLALLLAQAEVRRATEAGLAELLPSPRTQRGTFLLAASVAAVLVAGAVVLAGGLAEIAAPPREVPLPMVRLPRPAQTTLQFVQAAQPTPERVIDRITVRVVPAPVPPAPPAVAAAAPPGAQRAQVARAARAGTGRDVTAAAPPPPVPGTPASAAAAPTAPAPAVAVPGAATAAPAPPPLVSEADLIDLVLAAERSLRRTANQ